MTDRKPLVPEAPPAQTAGTEKFDVASIATTAVNRAGDGFLSLPVWGRIIVLSGTLCVIGVFLFYYYLPHRSDLSRSTPSPVNAPRLDDGVRATLTYKVSTVTRNGAGLVTAILKPGQKLETTIVKDKKEVVLINGQAVQVSIPSDSSFDGNFVVTNATKDGDGIWTLAWSQPGPSETGTEGSVSLTPYSQGGTYDPEGPNSVLGAQNREADDKSKEDQAATNWHYRPGADDPGEEKSITNTTGAGKDLDPQNYVHTKFYNKSDQCIEIVREEGGERMPSQWIKDRRYRRHDVHSTIAEKGPNPLPRGSDPVLAFALTDILPFSSPQMTPVQSYCVNPHPSPFRYWWGPPFDQCNSPMYRQFPDGCTHYQVYNRCANVWDPQIYWTYCHPPPHF